MNNHIRITIQEIKQCDNLALIHKIKHYLDFNKDIVLFAYAELIARGTISKGLFIEAHLESMNKDLNAFITSKGFSPGPDILLKELLISLDCDSYLNLLQNIGETATPPAHLRNSVSHIQEPKYPALRTISGVYTVFGYVLAGVSLIAGMILFYTSIWLSLTVIVVGAIIVLGLFALSEAIKVFIDIEENTRLRNKE